MKKNLTFIIVIYHPNQKKLEQLKQSLKYCSVLVIDNTKINRGYGGGANLGIRRAFKLGSEWVVILNQDLKLTKNALEQLEAAIKKSPPGIVGTFGGSLDKKRWTTSIPSVKFDYVSGACMAIHRHVLDKIGYFYEPYFMYYEDADYSLRATKAGFTLRLAKMHGIIHTDSPSLGKGSYLHEYYLVRNHLLFVERVAPLPVKVYEYFRLPITLLEYSVGKNFGAIEGVKDYLLRRFGEKL